MIDIFVAGKRSSKLPAGKPVGNTLKQREQYVAIEEAVRCQRKNGRCYTNNESSTLPAEKQYLACKQAVHYQQRSSTLPAENR
jgi:hypothetical protein